MTMACSVTGSVSSSSRSSRCTSSTTLIEGGSLPTISLEVAADDDKDHDTQLIADDADTDNIADEVAGSKSVPRVGHDRKKHHASYRYRCNLL